MKAALFADDVSFINSHHSKLVTEKELQCAVTAAPKWRTSKKLLLNADMWEVAFVSTYSNETTHNYCYFTSKELRWRKDQLKKVYTAL